MILEDHDKIVERCLELDALAKEERLVVYFITSDKHTFKLTLGAMYWGMLAENERYCMVKYGNYYLNRDAGMRVIAKVQSQYVEEDEDVLESNYASYLEAGGSGEPLSYEDWVKTQ